MYLHYIVWLGTIFTYFDISVLQTKMLKIYYKKDKQMAYKSIISDGRLNHYRYIIKTALSILKDSGNDFCVCSRMHINEKLQKKRP